MTDAAVSPRRLLVAALLLALLTACAGPAPPRWQVESADASARFVEAWLDGERRADQLEFARAREQLARTGAADRVAQVELLRCAVRLATLLIEPCSGFEALRGELAPGAQTAYADYLAGRLPHDAATRIALLPAAQRNIAAAPSATRAAELLAGVAEPLSRLVAAGVLVKTGRVTDTAVRTAVETASKQGWRRALLAWLLLEQQRARAAGDLPRAAAAQRRIELVAPTTTDAAAAP